MLAHEIKRMESKLNKSTNEFTKDEWIYISKNEDLSEEFLDIFQQKRSDLF